MAKKKIFISYNKKDKATALKVSHSLQELPQYDIWFDRHEIAPGQDIAKAITEGLNGSDYYLLLISADSNESPWVKKELALAFELSGKKQLAMIPFLIGEADIPFELKGLHYVDARARSFERGLDDLIDYFSAEAHSGFQEEGVLVGNDGMGRQREKCEAILKRLELGDLRYMLSERLEASDIGVLWFDLFNETMANEVVPSPLPLYCVELINRSRKKKILPKLYACLCRNHPDLAPDAIEKPLP